MTSVLAADAAATTEEHDKPRSLGRDALSDLIRRPVFIGSLLLIVLFLLMAAFPHLFTGIDPNHGDLDKSRQGPSAQAWFGYDSNGYSVYARVIYGARASIVVGVMTTLVTTVVGAAVGTLAGFYGRFVDTVISRLGDIFFGIPLLLGGVLILVSFPSDENTPYWVNIGKIVTALWLLGWPSFMRIMRASVMQVKSTDYVMAARALGARGPRILWRHVVPNALTPVIALATISLGGYIGAEATFSYLGIGLPPQVVSWGGMISDAQNYIQVAPHMLLFPAGALSLCVLAFIMLGDVVRDALDPKLR